MGGTGVVSRDSRELLKEFQVHTNVMYNMIISYIILCIILLILSNWLKLDQVRYLWVDFFIIVWLSNIVYC